MSEYLGKAAELLAKAAAANERDAATERIAGSTLRNVRMEVAHAYALLAAIDKGLLPEQAAENLYGRLGGGAG